MAYDPEGSWPTIATLTKDLDSGGKFLPNAIQLLNQTNEIADDMPFAEANEKTSHVHIMDADIPQGTWRRVNEGIKAVSSTSLQVRDTVGLMENRAEVDKVLARLSGDVASFRMRQDRRILEGINQQLVQTVFYGDPRQDAKRFYGFAPRYDTLGTPADKPSANTFGMSNVLDAGGSTADVQSSIWLIGWGVDVGAFGIYPNSAPSAGIEADDLGEIDLHDADGNVFRGYATHYRVQQGLAVSDWRNVVRIANIETAAALDEASINTLCDILIAATNTVPDLRSVRAIFYCNRLTHTRLQQMAIRKSNMSLGFADIYGVRNQLNISGIPIKRCDALLSTEAVVT